MTDNEIKIALECHASDAEVCKLCPLTNEEWCSVKLARKALDIINSKDSKIAELTEEINHQQAEIERLQNLTEKDFEQTAISTVKRHQKWIEYRAIKEFADRLKEKADYYENGQGWEGDIYYADDVDNLVKEMVGDAE